MTENKLITFIVPVYNVEKYLDQCLMSLKNQTVNNHKVIMVNDGSTDRSGEIAQTYVDRWPEMFSLLHKENEGQGKARNRGLEKVDTEYTGFLDSDDWLDLKYVEKIQQTLDKNPLDVVVTLPHIYNMVTKQYLDWYDAPIIKEVFRDKNRITSAVQSPKLNDLEANICLFVYSTQFLRDINLQFGSFRYWEDVPIRFKLFHHAQKVGANLETGFYYRVGRANQTTSKIGKERLMVPKVFKDTLQRARKENYSSDEIARIIHIYMKFSLWSIKVTNAKTSRQFIDTLHRSFNQISKSEWKSYINILNPGKKKELFIYVVKHPKLYKILYYNALPKLFNKVWTKLKSIKSKILR